MIQYVKWSAEQLGADASGAKAEDFYEDAWAQSIFSNFLATITSRVNSITGIPYRCVSFTLPSRKAVGASMSDHSHFPRRPL